MTFKYNYKQFVIFRVIFGIYLTIHFIDLLPYGPELFGSNGMIPDPNVIPTWKLFPSFLDCYKNDYVIILFINTLVVASIMFTFGFYHRIMAFILWYGWAYLLNRNIFISNPGIPYVGWLLLACIIIPEFSIETEKSIKNKWKMPPAIFWTAWFLMALGYTVSGLHKLQCPSWLNGSALRHVISSALARNIFFDKWLLAMPEIVLQILTWFSLIAEILFLPIGIFYHVRKWYWLLIVGMQLGILFLVNFTDLTFGVLMIHVFTFEQRWLREFPFRFIMNKLKFFKY